MKIRLTLLRNEEKGSPLSRANAQIMRDDVAVKPMVAAKTIIVITMVIPVPPAADPVACVKISMNGYLVGLSNAAFISPRLNIVAKRMAKPITPFSNILTKIDLGTLIFAFSISSDIWTAASAPGNGSV